MWGHPTRRAVIGGLAGSCFAGSVIAEPARRFRLGTTRWPPDLTLKALGQVEMFLHDHCDMSAPMVLGGVPWIASDTNEPFSRALLNELRWTPPKGHRVCLSLGPLDTARTGLAPLYAEKDNQPLPDDWADLPFDHPKVIDAYCHYCVEAARMMQPDWLVTGVEVNLLLHHRPDRWRALSTLMTEAYRAVKHASPTVQVGLSMTLTHLLGLSDGADPVIQQSKMEEIIGTAADFAGFSVYPHTSWDIPQPVPMGWYDSITDFGRKVGKPVAVTESGMTSRTFWIGLIRIKGSDDLQRAHVEALLDGADRGGWLFVVNWTSHDYPALMEHIPREVRSLAKIWTYTGLKTGDGEDKAALAPWERWRSRVLAP